MPGEPVSLAIVLCDHIIVEHGTGKPTLIGVFHVLGAPQFPFKLPRFIVHAPLTNFALGSEQHSATVNIKNMGTGGIVGSLSLPVKVPASLPPGQTPDALVLNLNLPFNNITFPSPGTYEIDVLYDGESIGKKYLPIKQVAAAQSNPTSPPIT
jgi:hypothetical protein